MRETKEMKEREKPRKIYEAANNTIKSFISNTFPYVSRFYFQLKLVEL